MTLAQSLSFAVFLRQPQSSDVANWEGDEHDVGFPGLGDLGDRVDRDAQDVVGVGGREALLGVDRSDQLSQVVLEVVEDGAAERAVAAGERCERVSGAELRRPDAVAAAEDNVTEDADRVAAREPHSGTANGAREREPFAGQKTCQVARSPRRGRTPRPRGPPLVHPGPGRFKKPGW